MSSSNNGKRLLDALHLLHATGKIARAHLAVRNRQWETYTATSSLAKTVKSQTDRVTVTAGAAWELGKRVVAESDNFQGSEEDAGRRKRRRTTATGVEGKEEAGRDTFSRREPDDGDGVGAREREEEAMPKVRIPLFMEDRQGADEEDGREVDQEVYYTRSAHAHSVEEEEGKLEGGFSSTKVAQMLGSQKKKEIQNPYEGRQKVASKPLPEMLAAEERRRRERENQMGGSTVGEAESHAGGHDVETQNLAASIAEEAQTQSTADTQPADHQPPPTPYEMRESRVPASRFGRLWEYGGLATSMAFGAVGESFRRFGGGSNSNNGDGSLMLSEANMNRLVAKLSRMRGAALKLGQMMSFQDSKLLPPTINAVLQRVQDSADYMPPSQRDKVLRQNLGDNWRDLFANFEEKPFAAASIGQVHKARLASNGKDVAVKVQYPGVRNSIDSDLNNLSLLLTASRLLPRGLYLDKTIANARVELGWECDYEREAQACRRFGDLVRDDGDTFVVPEIYSEACGPGVLTAEFMHGTAVTKIHDLTQHDRDWVGTQILRLCLRELIEWRFMQTDPNWTNFLYNRSTEKLELLDFGASREFPREFTEPYIRLLLAASHGDRAQCRDLSISLGYLTGSESSAMLDAHVDSVLVLAEPFRDTAPETYDFRDQTITDRVRANIGLMLRERLAPPPEETYSLHRKLSGAFLLCARMRSRVDARELFRDAITKWKTREGVVE